MATGGIIGALGSLRGITKYDPDIEGLPERYIWYGEDGELRMQELERRPRIGGCNRTPFEQAMQRLDDFCAGKPIFYPQEISNLKHRIHGVWELKTTHVRLFGWFPEKSHFLFVNWELKQKLLINTAYEPLIQEVLSFRSKLGLEKSVSSESGRLKDVL
ncbi:hypothetical protein AA0311_1513 [Asaia bogorensis NBRC 16594]|uniref:Uncharacterized protein n=2 Tax=Asaia bogorensis TaxID=91915 RepID=A0AAN4R7E8_9PROT|nr:hypothetical protein [Asaia bogorensis]BAT19796.1 hypothetical protein Asbog_01523 [Asaia bogorensis NBRC 16594]GBQ77676.1 hypothetical protein AA0311_1513 [Asaia bogorensis NBRC 16594]GEL54364.1 hypothetical protein ABO01nite_23710 [Asaia bogorensis NBRC 16594]